MRSTAPRAFVILAALSATPVIITITETLPASIRSGAVAMIYALAISIFGGSTQFTIKLAAHRHRKSAGAGLLLDRRRHHRPHRHDPGEGKRTGEDGCREDHKLVAGAVPPSRSGASGRGLLRNSLYGAAGQEISWGRYAAHFSRDTGGPFMDHRQPALERLPAAAGRRGDRHARKNRHDLDAADRQPADFSVAGAPRLGRGLALARYAGAPAR